jgi:hypothetical protein
MTLTVDGSDLSPRRRRLLESRQAFPGRSVESGASEFDSRSSVSLRHLEIEERSLGSSVRVVLLPTIGFRLGAVAAGGPDAQCREQHMRAVLSEAYQPEVEVSIAR